MNTNSNNISLENSLKDTFMFVADTWVLCLGLLLVMILCMYLGRRVGLWRKRTLQEGDDPASNTTMSAMFGLLAFVLAFTFGLSSGRFDTRRLHVVDEANAIGTAILRVDMYDEPDRSALRSDFRQYLEARLLYYEAKRDLDAVATARKNAGIVGKRIWKSTTELSKDPANLAATMQMIPALNAMFDIATTRLIGELSQVPLLIVIMLFVLSWTSAFYLGYSSAKKERMDWFLASGFCVLTSVVIYITLDLDRPRRGFIQLDTAHRAMMELRNQFEINDK